MNIWLYINSIHIKGLFYISHNSPSCLTEWILWIHNYEMTSFIIPIPDDKS